MFKKQAGGEDLDYLHHSSCFTASISQMPQRSAQVRNSRFLAVPPWQERANAGWTHQCVSPLQFSPSISLHKLTSQVTKDPQSKVLITCSHHGYVTDFPADLKYLPSHSKFSFINGHTNFEKQTNNKKTQTNIPLSPVSSSNETNPDSK